ncbi:ZnuC ABC-type Mn/Zn transport systems, ATPase component [Rhabdaerophilaceae bacterium]
MILTKSPGLVLRNLTLGYDQHPAVHHLDGQVRPGALLAIIGPNGSGKSTLLKGIAGCLPVLGGSIENSFARLAYMPQIGELNRDFPVSVFDLALTGLCSGAGLFGRISRADRDKAMTAIAAVGLQGFEDRSIRTLSGGQLQRLIFARLMLQDAELILLDEPFAAVDQRTTADLLAIIAGWHAEGRTVITVLHDVETVRTHFADCLLLARETIAWGPCDIVITDANLAQARSMSEAFDREAAFCHRAA